MELKESPLENRRIDGLVTQQLLRKPNQTANAIALRHQKRSRFIPSSQTNLNRLPLSIRGVTFGESRVGRPVQ